MKFSAAFTTSVLSACMLVSAVPMQTSNAGATKMMTKATRLDAQGAVYFITNEPGENMIIAATINADGTLNPDRAVATGGRGLHGSVATPGPDGLFSQGGIEASVKGKVLAAVNPGSNTISLFSIDPKTPTNLTPLGDPVSSEGEFPMSLTFNSAGDRLCVLNGGAVAAVNCYKVDKKLGLTAIPNTLRYLALKQTTPPAGPPNTASHIVFNHDESELIVSVKGAPPASVGYLATWAVAPGDGSLSATSTHIAPPPGGALPFSLTPVPGQNAFLATDPALGFAVFDLSGQNRSAAVAVAGQGATCWSSYSAHTGSYYLSDIGTATITEVRVDGNLQASVVKQYPQTAGSGTIDSDVVTVKGKDFLYVLAANATSVDVLALTSAGNAKRISTLDFSGPARAAGVPLDRNNVQGMTHFIKQ
ncbi:hypothetical protein C8T65DRAFT_99979 [Cerioporus squamosus]|nr:hypothetical protein C8T65DRAFT_99979 [Cerioporus squamosus]